MIKNPEISADHLRSILDYDAETGEFLWKFRADAPPEWNSRHAGAIAGCCNAEGYRRIVVGGRQVNASRLAWLYVTGSWPSNEVDHIDGNVGNDRFANLRSATRLQNARNRGLPRHNTTGLKGIKQNACKTRWVAQIGVAGRRIHLGTFDKPEDAHAAYSAAAKIHFGEFERQA